MQRTVDELLRVDHVAARANPAHRSSPLFEVTGVGRELFERLHADELRVASTMLRGFTYSEIDAARRARGAPRGSEGSVGRLDRGGAAMTGFDVAAATARNRVLFAETIEALPTDLHRAPTLCEGWEVRVHLRDLARPLDLHVDVPHEH